MATFQPSSLSLNAPDLGGGHDEDYYAQQMLTTYRSGMDVGAAEAPGFFDRAVTAAEAKGIDTGVKKTGGTGGGFFDFITQAGKVAAPAIQQAAQAKAAKIPECRGKPLFGKKKIAAWKAKCAAAQAAAAGPPLTAAELDALTEQPGVSPVWWALGGLAFVSVVGGGLYYMTRK